MASIPLLVVYLSAPEIDVFNRAINTGYHMSCHFISS